jgi:hypothetical protein
LRYGLLPEGLQEEIEQFRDLQLSEVSAEDLERSRRLLGLQILRWLQAYHKEASPRAGEFGYLGQDHLQACLSKLGLEKFSLWN